MRTIGILLVMAMTLAACGGGGSKRADRFNTPRSLFATGPIYSACLQAGRKAASRSLCGCVQAVADSSLRAGDISLATKFYSEPHHAQEIRQSDNPRNEAFWKRYKAYVARAEQSCS